MKNFALRVIAITVLVTLPSLSSANSDWYNSVLRSAYYAEEIYIFVLIDSRFFDPLKRGESLEKKILGSRDEIDKSLKNGGRVSNNVVALLSDKLLNRFSIRTVDLKVAPYRAWVNIRIVQQLDIYGKNTFEILLDIDFQEAATTRTGHEGFMSVYHFNGQTFANSKGEVESSVYAALDQAIDKMQKVFLDASEYCVGASCKH